MQKHIYPNLFWFKFLAKLKHQMRKKRFLLPEMEDSLEIHFTFNIMMA